MSLPCLPGNNFNLRLGKERFHKSHHFDYNNEVAMLTGEEKPGIGGEPLLGQKKKPKNSVFPRGEGSNAPTWVAFDRQVLCFQAYFQEAVHEKREEQFRIRNCKIYFYLEDDSIQVIEPTVKNSGIPQGTLIRRHRIPLPAPNDDQFYTVEHFNVGNEIVLYGRKFKLMDCDEFTRNFLRKLGVRVSNSERTPDDPYTSLRQDMEESMQPLRPYERTDTLKQFLSHDRHVLRFWCFWDDGDCMFGDTREMVLHYFLADDTVEIREVIQPNSGRDAVPVFVKRARLPKNAPLPLRQPGEKTDRTVLNVFGPMGHGGRYILDSLKTGAVYEDYYTDADLVIGAVLNVWGRKLVLCDSDNFTKEFYKSKYGIDDFTPIKYKADSKPQVPRPVPPYNGFGSEEDSLCSCMGLIPKPPQLDFIKFMERDRHGLESNVLRFVAYMSTDSPIDKDRKFIISYFLSDDTVSVFEPPQRNSGIIGGKFLERGRIKKPSQEIFKSEMSEYFTAQDFFVGANVTINDFNFTIVDADEYAFRYMEKHEDEFPVANMSVIIDKLRSAAKDKVKDIKEFFVMNDPEGGETIRYESFRNLLAQLKTFSEHEIMTIGRRYAHRAPEEVDMTLVLAVAQEKLKKKNFEDFARLQESLTYEDIERKGTLNPSTLRVVCRAFKLPLPEDVLQVLMKKLSRNGEIDYSEFVTKINWRENPVASIQYQQVPVKLDAAWQSGDISQVTAVLKVNYKELVEDVFGKQDV
ncbi:EF-hand domain-containing family member C2-like isoform X2 [Styela clava]|uniref:EF-hand domain-containing family member C2-like n=1 Tax=Styela clava TaxID=7725 RepID=UPI001939E10B|nr:EF-hand domain-containing family member C2-like [Styela clava]